MGRFHEDSVQSFKGCYKEVKRMVATRLDPALFSRVLKVHLHLSQAHVGRRKRFVVANPGESIVQLFSSPANVCESEYMKGVTNVASMQEPVLVSQVNGMPCCAFAIGM